MENLLLKSMKRLSSGKRATKILRNDGMLPGVLYRSGVQSVSLSIKYTDIQNIIKSSASRLFLLDLELEGKVRKVTIKELQRHPVSKTILHIDFYEVDMNQKIKVRVPIKTTGKSVGVESGGMLQIINRELDIICFPKDIPTYINVDITNLGIGDSIHVRDVLLSKKAEILGESNLTVLTILSQKKADAENTEVDETDENGDE